MKLTLRTSGSGDSGGELSEEPAQDGGELLLFRCGLLYEPTAESRADADADATAATEDESLPLPDRCRRLWPGAAVGPPPISAEPVSDPRTSPGTGQSRQGRARRAVRLGSV